MANGIQTGQVQPNAQKLSPAVRNANFMRMTRQYWQTEPTIAGTSGGSVSFDLTKVRLTSRVRLLIEADLKVTHASQTSFTPNDFAPYSMIRNVRVDINNGFSPFILTGRDLYLYNLMRPDAFQLERKTSGRGKVVMGNSASSSGATNKISFLADLPLALNDRDPQGLIITQNQALTVTVSVDFINDTQASTELGTGQAGYTYQLTNIVVTPLVETFSIPPTPDAFPDTSIVKLVQSTKQSIAGAGSFTLKLTTGYTYRKLAFFISDSNGVGVQDSALAGHIELILNQADTPYKVTAAQLAKINHEQFGFTLPQGVFAFDFSYQGIANLGGTRDYLDTERLTEFWLRFNAPGAGNISAVYEQLTVLK